MRILWLSAVPSHGADDAAALRTREIGRCLMARGHEVTCLLGSPEAPDEDARRQMRDFWCEFLHVPGGRKQVKKGHGTEPEDGFGPEMEGGVRLLQSRGDFDAVFCDHYSLSRGLTLFADETFKVLDLGTALQPSSPLSADDVAAQVTQDQAIIPPAVLDRAQLLVAASLKQRELLQARTCRPVLLVEELVPSAESTGMMGRSDSGDFGTGSDDLTESIAQMVRTLDVPPREVDAQLDELCLALEARSTLGVEPRRVLVVTDITFWSGGLGSHMRIRQLVAHLRRFFFVRVFYLGRVDAAQRRAIREAGLDGVIVEAEGFGSVSPPRRPPGKVPIVPALVPRQKDIHLTRLKNYLAAGPRYDVAVLEYIWLGYLADALPAHTMKVLDTHDVMSFREYQFQSRGEKTSISITLNEELSVLDAMDAVIAIQSEEARSLANLLKRSITLCCPHGVEAGLQMARPEASEKFSIGFIGANSAPNRSAVRWFINHVMPCVQGLPIELNVYGGVCAPLGAPPTGVVFHGFVDDLEQAYCECEVFVNPVVHGGGIKIKSLEALAHGKPLIASPEGTTGIDCPEESGVIVASSRTEFVNALLLLMRDEALRSELSGKAIEAARHQFQPERSYRDLVGFIERV